MDISSKIYIAGHTGLVGSAIHRNLIDKGYSNFVFTPFPEFDLIDQKTVKDFFEREKPEYVFLAAAKVGGIVANNIYRADFIYQNIQIQNNIIHYSYQNNVKKLLFLGSSCIYPKNCPQPIKEEYLLTDELEYTNEPYAIAKIAGIKMCESYNLQYGTNFIAVMPTNLYGPNDNYNLETSHVLPALIRKMHLGKCLMNNDWKALRLDLDRRPIEGINGQSNEKQILAILQKYGISIINNQLLNPEHEILNLESGSGNQQQAIVTLWGTGTPRREFLYSDDLADACIYLMHNVDFKDLTKNSKEVKNTHINIGTGKDFEIRFLADLVKQIIDFKGKIIWDNSKPDGTKQKLLNVDKINKLGWMKKNTQIESIGKVYNNYLKIAKG